MIERVGRTPEKLKPVAYAQASKQKATAAKTSTRARPDEGIRRPRHFPRLDRTATASELGPKLEQVAGELKLQSVANRGVKVYPGELPDFVYSDLWNCRFLAQETGAAVTHEQTIALQERVTAAGFDVVKTEGLYTFDGERGYSLGQGE